jgi:hypothetical protein
MSTQTSTFNALILPLLSDTAPAPDFTATPGVVGLCFSGGGSRALTCALGQLRGLFYLRLLDKVFAISSVSGGSWASAIFTYLPADISDADFLGPVNLDPGSLTIDGLQSMPPNCLGWAPTRLASMVDLASILEFKLYYDYPNDQLWQGLVGRLILGPYGLWNPDENGFDQRYYSWTAALLKSGNGILARNQSLRVANFYTVQRPRPFLVVNSSFFMNDTVNADLVPFESTFSCGVRAFFPKDVQHPDDIGGGLVEAFAMGSTYQSDQPNNIVAVTAPTRAFSLSDIVGVSSVAPAQWLEEQFPVLNGLVPRYRYWPVRNRQSNPAREYRFADGGSLENLGVNSLLARGVSRLLVFVNTDQAVQQTDDGAIIVSDDIPPLFGFQPYAPGKGYVPYSKDSGTGPSWLFRHNQVFDSAAFSRLTQGLFAAKKSKGTVMFAQRLVVLANPYFGVSPGLVNVLWIYNDLVTSWWDRISSDVRLYIDYETYGDFPMYDTFTQLYLPPAAVNALAHLSAWNVASDSTLGHPGFTNRQIVESMFATQPIVWDVAD